MKRCEIISTKAYTKDLKRLGRSGINLSKLENVIDMLALGKILPDRYQDHALHGGLRHLRECHIAPNWLLVYKKDDSKLILVLVRTGTHRDVLGIE